jgi:hypothetical protein
MTGLLGLSAGAYYRWAKYGLATRRQEADAELLRLKLDGVKLHAQFEMCFSKNRVRER